MTTSPVVDHESLPVFVCVGLLEPACVHRRRIGFRRSPPFEFDRTIQQSVGRVFFRIARKPVCGRYKRKRAAGLLEYAIHVLSPRCVPLHGVYLSVNAPTSAFTLVEQFPRLCKIGAPDEVEHIVNSALLGIPLKAVQRVPAAIPVRLDNQYFALDSNDPAHARMLAARACQIYLPASVPDASLELYAVLRS
ncbi:type VI secretion system baseplate subunit TssK [Burkholderia diffusa]|uniref:type VI secretion system baseplate subunit TssK n=1 Tax=Burkholderia diffusa TaxID=488732 RepID=UPI002AB06BA0|nr:type VI secretion system baseplate subunit TssK [Burkholderia diffusa]